MIRCTKFRPLEKITLKGFADLELTRIGIVIHDCPWHVKGSSEWIAFPARAYEGLDGGRKWTPIVEFAADAATARATFQREALAAVHAFLQHDRERDPRPRRDGVAPRHVRTPPLRLEQPRSQATFDDRLDDLPGFGGER